MIALIVTCIILYFFYCCIPTDKPKYHQGYHQKKYKTPRYSRWRYKHYNTCNRKGGKGMRQKNGKRVNKGRRKARK